MWASSEGHHNVVSAILCNSAAEVNGWDTNKCTSLMVSSGAGHFKVVELLLEHRADRHIKSDTGKTALDYAREAGHTEIIDLLLNYPDSAA
jgi:ankyrin repeat protein